jgi:hypothetical protein
VLEQILHGMAIDLVETPTANDAKEALWQVLNSSLLYIRYCFTETLEDGVQTKTIGDN